MRLEATFPQGLLIRGGRTTADPSASPQDDKWTFFMQPLIFMQRWIKPGVGFDRAMYGLKLVPFWRLKPARFSQPGGGR